MQTRKQELASEINNLKKQLKNHPIGNFFCTFDQKTYRWYYSHNGQKHYIPKSNRKLAEKLAIKKFISLQLKDLTHELTATNFYLRHHSAEYKKSWQLLINHPEYQRLLSDYFKPIEPELADWANEPYTRNPHHPEHLIFPCASGNVVRSKSEFIIDSYLYFNKIPYRYEAELILDGQIYYPDFTIRHPTTGEIFYFEHFGKMDDMKYVRKSYNKLKHYASHNIIPSINLVTTYETAKHPLDSLLAEQLIKYYFL